MSRFDFLLALALWGLWLLYWLASARGGKPVQRRESPVSRMLQTVTITAGGLLVLLPGWGPTWFNQPLFAPMPWTGTVLIASGLLFTVWARRCLGSNWSADVAIRESHELVRTGPYRLVRHPIYTGGLLAVLGTLMMGGLWRGVIGLVLVVGTLAYKLRLEEAWLSSLFGEAYTRYRAEVPALIPLLHR